MDLNQLKRDKDVIRSKKLNSLKQGVPFGYASKHKEDTSNKAITKVEDSLLEVEKQLVINAMGLVDFDNDVILEGAFKKSVNENKAFYLLKEHNLEFDSIIASSRDGELTASLKQVSLKSLGLEMEGETEVLLFDAKIKKETNSKMFEMYAKNRVKEHSVGMRYVKMFLCVDSNEEDWQEEKQNWDKYIGSVKNTEDLNGFFWAVTEAKFIEGSAVPFGANRFTPDITEEKEIKDTEEKEVKKTNFDLSKFN